VKSSRQGRRENGKMLGKEFLGNRVNRWVRRGGAFKFRGGESSRRTAIKKASRILIRTT